MIMDQIRAEPSKDANGGQIDLTKPMSGWFKSLTQENKKEKDNSREINVTGSTETTTSVGDKMTNKTTNKTTNVGTTNVTTSLLCKSIIGCGSLPLKGFEYCHKHILEDKSSPFRRCGFISKSDYKRCRNPTPIRGEKRAYCTMHEKERKRAGDGSKSKTKKKKNKHPASPHRKPNKKRPSTLPVSVSSSTASVGGGETKNKSSSDEEEFSFFTDTVQVNKTDCLWLGNQASEAESTDSEDENLLNHAGVWTVEECIRILKEKLERIRYLYALQYKRLNYCLKEERRKMLAEYDMDPVTLSKVGFEGCPEAPFEKFVEGVHLTNYQKLTGPELICERQMKEKRNKGTTLHSRKNDLPRCMMSIDGQRCNNRLLPLTRYCHTHILHDSEQYLFTTCTFKYIDGKKCIEPASSLSSACNIHQTLSAEEKYKKAMELFASAKQRAENRKRRMIGKEREKEKKEARAKRSSTRLKEGAHSISEDCNISSSNAKTSCSNLRTSTSNARTSSSNSRTSSFNKSNSRERKSSLPELSKDIQRETNIFEKGLFQSTQTSAKSSTDESIVTSNVVKGAAGPLLGDNGVLPTIVEGKN